MFYAVAVIATVFTSMGHIYFKKFALKSKKPLPLGLLDRHLAIGCGLFVLGVIAGIAALVFIEWSAFYSVTALNYLFISVLSKVCLRERIDKAKLIGNLIIVAGILAYNA